MTNQECENWQKEMFTVIEQWEISGISHKAFCDQHELRSHVFYYWLNKYKRTRSTSGSSFVPVEISPGETIELVELPVHWIDDNSMPVGIGYDQ